MNVGGGAVPSAAKVKTVPGPSLSVARMDSPKNTAPPDRNRDILNAIDHVGRGSGDDAGTGWRFPQLLTRCVGYKAPVRLGPDI